jgi:hypothetical protein
MGNRQDSRQPVKVGVLLRPAPEDLGMWLAEAAAFDAAGADALWVDVAGDERLDPLAVTAALAAITVRSLLVTAAPEVADGRTLDTIGRLSRGRFALCGDRTRLAVVPDVAAFYQLDDGTFVRETPGGEPERWVRTAWTRGRAAWRTAIAEAVESGAGGLLVPALPPLLDILRNPGDAGDRRDLQLAQG